MVSGNASIHYAQGMHGVDFVRVARRAVNRDRVDLVDAGRHADLSAATFDPRDVKLSLRRKAVADRQLM